MEHDNRAGLRSDRVVTIRHITHVNDAGTHVHAGMALVQVSPASSRDRITLMCPCNTAIYTQFTVPYTTRNGERDADDDGDLLDLEVVDATAGSSAKPTSTQSDSTCGVHFFVDLSKEEQQQQHLFAVVRPHSTGESEGTSSSVHEFRKGVTEMLVSVGPAEQPESDSPNAISEREPCQHKDQQVNDVLRGPERRGTCILLNFTPTASGFLSSVLRGMHKSVVRGRLVLLFPDGGADRIEGDPFTIGHDFCRSRAELFTVNGQLSLSSHRVSVELQVATDIIEGEAGVESKWVSIAVTAAQLIPPYSIASASTASHTMVCVGAAATEAVAHCTLYAAAVPHNSPQKTWSALRSQCATWVSQSSRNRSGKAVKRSDGERLHSVHTQCAALLSVRGFLLWDARDDATGVAAPSQQPYPHVFVTVSGGHRGVIATSAGKPAQLPAARLYIIAQATFTASHPTAVLSICGTSQNNLFGYATFTPFEYYDGAEESLTVTGNGWLSVHGIAGECGAVLVDYVLAFSDSAADSDDPNGTTASHICKPYPRSSSSPWPGEFAKRSEHPKNTETGAMRWGTIALEVVRARGLRFNGLGSACSAYATLIPLPLVPAPTASSGSAISPDESATHRTGTVECSNDPRWDAMFMLRNTPTTSEGLVVRVIDTDAVDSDNVVGSAFLLWDEPLWERDTGEVWVPLVTDTCQSWQCVGVLLVRWTVLGRCYPSARAGDGFNYQQRYGQVMTALSVPVRFANIHLSWPLLSFCAHASFPGALGLVLEAAKAASEGRSQYRLLLRASADGGQHKCTLPFTAFHASTGVATFDLPRRFPGGEQGEAGDASATEEFLACLLTLSPESGSPCRQMTVWLEVEFDDSQRGSPALGTPVAYTSRVIGSGSGKIRGITQTGDEGEEGDSDTPRWCSEVELRISTLCRDAVPFSDPAVVRMLLSPSLNEKENNRQRQQQQLSVRSEQDTTANLQYIQMGTRIAEGTHARNTPAPRVPEIPEPPILSCVEEQDPVPVPKNRSTQPILPHVQHVIRPARPLPGTADEDEEEEESMKPMIRSQDPHSVAPDICCDASVPPTHILDGGMEVEIIEARHALSAAGAAETSALAADAHYGVVLGCGAAFRCATALRVGTNPIFCEAYVVPVHLLVQPRGSLRMQLLRANRTVHHADEVVGTAVLSCEELEQCADDGLPVWVTMRTPSSPMTAESQHEIGARVLIQVRWRGSAKETLEKYRNAQQVRQILRVEESSAADSASSPVAALGELGKQLHYWEIFVGGVEGGLDEWVRSLLPGARGDLVAAALVTCETPPTTTESATSQSVARGPVPMDPTLSAMTSTALVRRPQGEPVVSSIVWAERFLMPFGHGESVFHFKVRVHCKGDAERTSYIWLDASTHFAQEGARSVGYWVEDTETWSLLTLRMRATVEDTNQEQHQRQFSSSSDLWRSPCLRVALRRRVLPLHNINRHLSGLPRQLKLDHRQQSSSSLSSSSRPCGLTAYPTNNPLTAVLSIECVHLIASAEPGSTPTWRRGSGSVEVLLTTHAIPDPHSVSCARFVGILADPAEDQKPAAGQSRLHTAFEPRSQTVEAMNNSAGLLEVIDSQSRKCLARGIITFATTHDDSSKSTAKDVHVAHMVVPLYSRHAPLQDGLRGSSIGTITVQLIHNTSSDTGDDASAASAKPMEMHTIQTSVSAATAAAVGGGVAFYRVLTVRSSALSGVVDAVDPRKAALATNEEGEQGNGPPCILRLEAQACSTNNTDASDECRHFHATPQSFYVPQRCSQCLSAQNTFPSPLSSSLVDLRMAPPFFQFVMQPDAASSADDAVQDVPLLFDIRLLAQASADALRLAAGRLTVPSPALFPSSVEGNESSAQWIPLHAIGAENRGAVTTGGDDGAEASASTVVPKCRDAIRLLVRTEWQYRAWCGLRMTCIRVRTARRSSLVNPFVVFVVRHSGSDRVSSFPLAIFPEKTGTLRSSAHRRRHLNRAVQLPLWSLQSVLLPLVTLPLLHAVAGDAPPTQAVLEQIQLRDRLSAHVDTLVGVCNVPSATEFTWSRWMFNRQPQWVLFNNGDELHAPHEVLLQACVESAPEASVNLSQPSTIPFPPLLIGSSMQHKATFTARILRVRLDNSSSTVGAVQVCASLCDMAPTNASGDSRSCECTAVAEVYKVEGDDDDAAAAEYEATWELSDSPAVSYTFTPTSERNDAPIPPPVEVHVSSTDSASIELLGTGVFAWNDYCYAHSGVATVGIQKKCGCRIGALRVSWDISVAEKGERDRAADAVRRLQPSSKEARQSGEAMGEAILNDIPQLPQCVHTIRSAPPSPPTMPSSAATVVCRASVIAARGLKLALRLLPKDDCCASSAEREWFRARDDVSGDALQSTVVQAVIKLRSKKKGRAHSTLVVSATCNPLATAVQFEHAPGSRTKEHTPLTLTLADLDHPGSTLSLWQTVSAKEAYFLGRVTLNMSVVRTALHGVSTKTVQEPVSVWLPLHTRSSKHLAGSSVRLHLLPPPATVAHPRAMPFTNAARSLTTKWALCLRMKSIDMVTTELPLGTSSSQLPKAAAVRCVLSWWTLTGADRHSATSLRVHARTASDIRDDGDGSASVHSHQFELVPTTALLSMGPLTLTECKPNRFFDISIAASTSPDGDVDTPDTVMDWGPVNAASSNDVTLATTRVSFADLQGPKHQSPIAQLMEMSDVGGVHSTPKDFSSPLEVLLRNSDSSVWATLRCDFMWCHTGDFLLPAEQEDVEHPRIDHQTVRTRRPPSSYLSATSRSCTVLPIHNASSVVGPQGCAGDAMTSFLFGGLRSEEGERVSVCTCSWDSCANSEGTSMMEITLVDDGDARDGPRESLIGHSAVAVSDGAFVVDGGIVAATAEDAERGAEGLLHVLRAMPSDTLSDSLKAAQVRVVNETWKFTPCEPSHGFWEPIVALDGRNNQRSSRAFHTAVFCAVLNTIVYFGGWKVQGDGTTSNTAASVTNEVHCLRLDSNKWETRMPAQLATLSSSAECIVGHVPPLAAHSAVLCGERLMIVFGGLSYSPRSEPANNGDTTFLSATSNVHILDLEIFRWSTHRSDEQLAVIQRNTVKESNKLNWPSPRFGHSAVWLPGRGSSSATTNAYAREEETEADFGTMLVFGGDRLFDADELLWSFNIRDRRWQRIEIHHSVPLLPRFLSSLVVFQHTRSEAVKRGKTHPTTGNKYHHKRAVVTVEEEVTLLVCGGCLPRHSDRSSAARRHRLSTSAPTPVATPGMLHGLSELLANIRDPQPSVALVLREAGVLKSTP